MRKGEIEGGERPGWSDGEPLKNFKVWSYEALKTVKHDLLENGQVFIRYESGQGRKKRELDYYLATQGIKVISWIEGDWYRLEYKGDCEPLIVCLFRDCMKVAVYEWTNKQMAQIKMPCCQEHSDQVKKQLDGLLVETWERREISV